MSHRQPKAEIVKSEEELTTFLISRQTINKPSHTSSPVRENTMIYDFVSIIRLKYLKHMLGFSNNMMGELTFLEYLLSSFLT